MTFQNPWKLVLWFVIILWLQMSVVPIITFFDLAPDLPLLLVAFVAFLVEPRKLVPCAFLMGLLKDLLSNSFFGLETASFALSSLALQQIINHFDRQDEWVQIWGTFLFSLCSLTIYVFVLSSVKDTGLGGGFTFTRNLLISGYTTLLLPVVFPCFKWIFGMKTSVKQYELF